VLGADPDELLALAGKMPSEIRDWTARDPRAVRLLRRLPELNPEVREELFRLADVD
jgi:hypothetical protein